MKAPERIVHCLLKDCTWTRRVMVAKPENIHSAELARNKHILQRHNLRLAL